MSSTRANSSSSSSTVSGRTTSEQYNDPSNTLYHDSEHYQNIFKNDSRFFDTSLHLFKCYRNLGYIDSNYQKVKKRGFSTTGSSNTVRSSSNGLNTLLRSHQPGFSSNHDINGTPKSNLTRNAESFKSYRSNLSPAPQKASRIVSTPMTRAKPPSPDYYRRIIPPPTTSYDEVSSVDSLDDPDIIVTRL